MAKSILRLWPTSTITYYNEIPAYAWAVDSAAYAWNTSGAHVRFLKSSRRNAKVLVGIRWVDGGTVKRWRQGQVDCLESAIQTSPPRITEAMTLLRSWAAERGLLPSETPYIARTPQRQALRFSKSGDPNVEQLYRTHWVSPDLS